MGRSPGFGSTACDYNPLRGRALFRLAFATAPGVNPLTSPQTVTRRLILQKARHQPVSKRTPGPLTACRSKVSGSISLRVPRFFSPFPHGTLHYRSPSVFSLTLWSAQIPPGFRVSRGTRVSSQEAGQLSPTGLSPSVASVSTGLRLTAGFVTPRQPGRADRAIPRHRVRNGCRLGTYTV